MFATLKQSLSGSLLLLVLALVTGTTPTNIPSDNSSSSTRDLTSASSSETAPAYPPPGLLDSLASMKNREELYQHSLSATPDFTPLPALPTAGGIIASMRSFESAYRSLLLSLDVPEGNGRSTNTVPPSGLPSLYTPYLPPPPAQTAYTTAPLAPGFGLPKTVAPPPPATQIPTPSQAPQLPVVLSLLYGFLLASIIFLTLSTTVAVLGGLGPAILVLLLLNLISHNIVHVHAEAHPDILTHGLSNHTLSHHHTLQDHHTLGHHHPHHHIRSVAAPVATRSAHLKSGIGGLRPGPIGKIPCVPGTKIRLPGSVAGVKDAAGGVPLGWKSGGLKGEVQDLFCGDWTGVGVARGVEAGGEVGERDMERANAVVLATESVDAEDELTTTIHTTTWTTLCVTVPNPTITATTYRLGDSLFSAAPDATPTASGNGSSPLSPGTSTTEESSAVSSAVPLRKAISYLLVLYCFGILACLVLAGPTTALGYLAISCVLAAIIAGAEGAAVPGSDAGHYSFGFQSDAVGKGIVLCTQTSNHTHAYHRTGILAATGIKELCCEVLCLNLSHHTVNRSTLIMPSHPPPFSSFEKRMSAVYITVPPTSGIIAMEGPQIIPITVESTVYEDVVETTVDVVTQLSTRTRTTLVPTTRCYGPVCRGKTVKAEGLSMLSGERVPASTTTSTSVTLRTRTVTLPFASASYPSTETSEVRLSTTVFSTTTYTPLPTPLSTSIPPSTPSPSSSSSSSSTPSSSTPQSTPLSTSTPSSSSPSSSSSSDPSSSTPPAPLPTTSTSSANQLYLSFVETNLYCFVFLFIGLNLALTTSHPALFLGSMLLLCVVAVAALEMCVDGQGLLRCNGLV